MSGVKVTQVEKTGTMKKDMKVESPQDFLKAVAGLKSKLFHLRMENKKLQSDLTSTTDQKVQLLQKMEEENTKVRQREVELERLLAAERAHSRELEIAMAAMAAAPQASEKTTLLEKKTALPVEKTALPVEKTALLVEKIALLKELKTAENTSAGDHQRTAASPDIKDKVVEAGESQPRREKTPVRFLPTQEEDQEKLRRRCQELEASLLQAAECSRRALQDKDREHLAELELLDQEMVARDAAVMQAERLISIRADEWQQEKHSFIQLAEINRQSLKDEEQEFLAKLRRQREEKEKLEQEFAVKAKQWREDKASFFNINNLDKKALQEKQLELEDLRERMSRRRNRKWYQRIVPRCLRAQDP